MLTGFALLVSLVSGAPLDPLVHDLFQARTAHRVLGADTPSASSLDRALRLIDATHKTGEHSTMALIGLHTILEKYSEVEASPLVNAAIRKLMTSIDNIFVALNQATLFFSAEGIERAKNFPLRNRVVLASGIGSINAYVHQIVNYGRPSKTVKPLEAIMTSFQNIASLMHVAKGLDFSKLGPRLGAAFRNVNKLVVIAQRLRWVTLHPQASSMRTGFEWFLDSEELEQFVSVMEGYPAMPLPKGKGLMVLDSHDEAVIFADISEFAFTQIPGSESIRSQIENLMRDISLLGNENLDAVMQRLVLFRDALHAARQLGDSTLVRAVHVELFRNVMRAWAHLEQRMRPFSKLGAVPKWLEAINLFFTDLIIKSHPFSPIHRWIFNCDNELKRPWLAVVLELRTDAFVKDMKSEEAASFILNSFNNLKAFFAPK